MKIVLSVAIFLLAMICSTQAEAIDNSTQDVLVSVQTMRTCLEDKNNSCRLAEYAKAFGYLVALADEQSYLQSMGRPTAACFPQGYTYGQLKQAFLNYSEKHPELWQDRPIESVIKSYSVVFPCKN